MARVGGTDREGEAPSVNRFISRGLYENVADGKDSFVMLVACGGGRVLRHCRPRTSSVRNVNSREYVNTGALSFLIYVGTRERSRENVEQ